MCLQTGGTNTENLLVRESLADRPQVGSNQQRVFIHKDPQGDVFIHLVAT